MLFQAQWLKLLLLSQKLALKTAFNILTTDGVSCFGQYDRIDDLIPFNLRGDKRPVFRQFLVDEFHLSAVFKFLDPLFVWHFRPSSAEISVCREYVVRCEKLRVGNEKSGCRTS